MKDTAAWEARTDQQRQELESTLNTNRAPALCLLLFSVLAEKPLVASQGLAWVSTAM